MSLKTDIQTAYEEQEDVETAARELNAYPQDLRCCKAYASAYLREAH